MKKLFSPNKNYASPKEQGVDFVELFFDLVFVFAITRITALAAHHLDVKHVFQSVLIFWLIWWGWTQFTWALNAAHTKLAEVRLMVLIATAVAFVMASSVDLAFQDGVFWFAIPYIIIRIIGLNLYIRVSNHSKEQRSAILLFALISAAGLIAVVIGGLVNPSLRILFWFAAIVFDMLAGFVAGRADGWNLLPSHFIERHGLIVIIALGESLIVAASVISGQERSYEIMIGGGLAVLITCLLWWSYFSWLGEYLEEYFTKRKPGSDRATTGRDAFSFMHFLIICGIIGVAIGFEKILQHPHEPITAAVAYAFGGGYLLFIGFSAASVWRTGKLLLLSRIIILLITGIGLFFAIGQAPVIFMLIVTVSLLFINYLEWKKCRHS